MPKVFISFATEDFVSPQHDDVLLRLTGMLEKRGVTGNFHVTGDLVRSLRDRRSTDVIKALGRHEIGYHSNTHGACPFLAGACEDMSWDDAVSVIAATESKGIIDIADIMGKRPTYYVTEFVKAPQLIHALKCVGVDVLGFSNVPTNGAPFSWYTGSLCYGGLRMGLELPPATGERARMMMQEFDDLCCRAEESGNDFVINIFHHPYKVFCSSGDAWGRVNDVYRTYRPENEWAVPVSYTPDLTKRLYDDMERVFDHVAGMRDVEFVTVSSLAEQYRQEWPVFVDIRVAIELAHCAAQNCNFVLCDGMFFAPSEILGILVDCLDCYRERGRLPDRVPFRRLIGPVDEILSESKPFSIDLTSFLLPMRSLNRALSFYQRIPSAIQVEGRNVHVGSLLKSAAMVVECLIEDRHAVKRVCVENASPYPVVADDPYFCAKEFKKDIYPEGFTGKVVCESCRRQTWSYKPAIRKTRSI